MPSHIGINGNHKADELADVRHEKFPLLFGHISVNMVGRVEDGAEGEEDFDKQSLLGMGEEEPAEEEDPCAFSAPLHHANEELCTLVKTSPQMRRHQGEGKHPPWMWSHAHPGTFGNRATRAPPPPNHHDDQSRRS